MTTRAFTLLSAAAFAVSSAVPFASAPYVNGQALFSKMWTVQEGLGPRFNAASCRSCHSDASSAPTTGPSALVSVSQDVIDPTGGHLFQRFSVRPDGAISGFEPPPAAGRRRAPALFGLGLLERAVLDSASPGRFGWKARYPDLESVVAGALAGEMGLTSDRFPLAVHGRRLGAPEVSPEQVRALASFVRSLPPPQPAVSQAALDGGEALFVDVGCARCHQPRLELRSTSRRGEQMTARAFTDLRLHDLGPALADGISEGHASPSQFRTAPLWGIGRQSSGFLHDGRAATMLEAIVAHDGDARDVTDRFRRLDAAGQAALLAFLARL